MKLSEFFQDELHGWTQGAAARDSMDKPCSPTAPWATSWSLYGALELLPSGAYNPHAYTSLARVLPWPGLIEWNDREGRTRAHVVELCRELGI